MANLPTQEQITTAISCTGLTVRTKNADEMNPETAKIGGLWQTFQHTLAQQMNEKTQVFGVYHNYESDVNGEFDVTACIANVDDNNDATTTDDALKQVDLPAGNYLVFAKQGAMPQAVIDAWKDVWDYFSDSSCSHKRNYKVDFEKYMGTDAVAVYIGIE